VHDLTDAGRCLGLPESYTCLTVTDRESAGVVTGFEFMALASTVRRESNLS